MKAQRNSEVYTSENKLKQILRSQTQSSKHNVQHL